MAGKYSTADLGRIEEKSKQLAHRSRIRKERSRSAATPSPERAFKVSTPEYLDLGSIPPAIVDDPQQAALDFIFSTYARPSMYKFEHRGFLQHVFEVYESAAQGSAARLSTLAIGTFLLGSWMNQRHDSQASRAYYSKAVSAMKEQLTSTVACSNDEMLVSILLLQLYETLVGTLKTGNQSRAHLNGALAVIKHRGIESFSSELSHGLLLSVRLQVIDGSLQTRRSLPAEVFKWSSVRPESDQLPRNQLDIINMRIATLQAMAPSIPHTDLRQQNQNMQNMQNIQKIFNRATIIEQLLASWYSNLPQAWFPIRVSTKENFPESIAAAGVYQQLCDVYPSVSVAGTFNKYRISLIRVKAMMLNCLSQQARTITSFKKQADLMNEIQVLADDVCASVPIHLGDRIQPGWLGDKTVHYPCAPGQELPEGQHQIAQAMGGWQLLDPLKCLLVMKIKLRPAQREWIGGQMMRIAHIYNFNF